MLKDRFDRKYLPSIRLYEWNQFGLWWKVEGKLWCFFLIKFVTDKFVSISGGRKPCTTVWANIETEFHSHVRPINRSIFDMFYSLTPYHYWKGVVRRPFTYVCVYQWSRRRQRWTMCFSVNFMIRWNTRYVYQWMCVVVRGMAWHMFVGLCVVIVFDYSFQSYTLSFHCSLLQWPPLTARIDGYSSSAINLARTMTRNVVSLQIDSMEVTLTKKNPNEARWIYLR